MIGDKFLTKLDPTEGLFAISVAGIGIVGFLFALSSLFNKEDFVGRLWLGGSAVVFAVSYLYHTAKTINRR